MCKLSHPDTANVEPSNTFSRFSSQNKTAFTVRRNAGNGCCSRVWARVRASWGNGKSWNKSGEASLVLFRNQYSAPCVHSVCVCVCVQMAAPWPCHKAPQQHESQSISICPSNTSSRSAMCEGIPSHLALWHSNHMACGVSWGILGSRNIQQKMFSLVFLPELHMDGNFHTVKESSVAGRVLWQQCFDYSPVKPEASPISPASKFNTWGCLVSKIFSSYTLSTQQMPHSAPQVELPLGRMMSKGTGKVMERNQRHRGGENPDCSDLEGVWEKQQWPMPLSHGLHCLARCPCIHPKSPLPCCLPWSSALTAAARPQPSALAPEVLTGLCFQVLL